MASYKKKGQYCKNDNNPSNAKALKVLSDLYRHAIHIDIIESVARSQQWNLQKTCLILKEMSQNVVRVNKSPPKRRSRSSSRINTVVYGSVEDDDADVVIESENGSTLAGQGTYSKIAANKNRNSPKPGNGAVKKKIPAPAKSKREKDYERVCARILTGNKVMVIMRGLPGCGKSRLARMIVSRTVCENHKKFVFSTDDYFLNNGVYNFNGVLLQEAHTWNHRRVFEAAQMGISPIIVDNTNTQAWEMRVYLMTAVQFGYQVEILEPDTPWLFNVPELARRNTHKVSRQKIGEMLQRYEKFLSVQKLFQIFCLQYPQEKQPPQVRMYPPPRNIVKKRKKAKANKTDANTQDNVSVVSTTESTKSRDRSSDTWDSDNEGTWEELQMTDYTDEPDVMQSEGLFDNDAERDDPFATKDSQTSSNEAQTYDLLSTEPSNTMEYVLVNPDNTYVYQKNHDAYIPQDLINFNDNDATDNISNSPQLIQFDNIVEPKPVQLSDVQASFQTLNFEDSAKENVTVTENSFTFPKLDFSYFYNHQPWGSFFKTPPANSSQETYSHELINQMKSKEIGTNTRGTDFLSLSKEPGDDSRVLFGCARDINSVCVIKPYKPPPKILMLEKGTMTSMENIMDTPDSNKQLEYFSTLLNLFPHVEEDVLKDMFEKCRGDVNWTVDLLLESGNDFGVTKEQREVKEWKELPQGEEWGASRSETQLLSTASSSTSDPTDKDEKAEIPKPQRPKNKFEDEFLKRHIEQQFKISDDHYSEYLLNLRKKRHGEIETTAPEASTSQVPPVTAETETDQELPPQSANSEEEEVESEEELIEVNLGRELVNQLENLFATSHTEHYPTGFQPVVQMPASLAHQLYSLWLQSVRTQMTTQTILLQEIELQDQELAQKLQQIEANAIAGPAPAPDLQEIMDMEIALAIYRADQQQWKKETPDDLASRMTRQKLFEAFPELDREVLTEILQAHNNSFEQTVQALLCSIGRTQNDKIMTIDGRVLSKNTEQDMAKQKQLLEKAKSESLKVELPKGQDSASGTSSENDEITRQKNANHYRMQAAHHLNMRQQLFNKANESIHKGLFEVAQYYAQVAQLHMQKYEIANSRAASAFLSEHALSHQDMKTLDLHYLYVREAEEALAMFLDSQISRLNQHNKNRDALFIITGRGNRSARGVSQIKPAIKRRLKERKLGYAEVNPGLLKVIITRHSILTNDLKN